MHLTNNLRRVSVAGLFLLFHTDVFSQSNELQLIAPTGVATAAGTIVSLNPPLAGPPGKFFVTGAVEPDEPFFGPTEALFCLIEKPDGDFETRPLLKSGSPLLVPADESLEGLDLRISQAGGLRVDSATGKAVFIATESDGGPGRLILIDEDSARQLAGPGTSVPGAGAITILDIIVDSLRINAGKVAFVATTSTRLVALFLWSDGTLETVFRAGAPFPGLAGSTVAFIEPPALSREGALYAPLLFRRGVFFEDGILAWREDPGEPALVVAPRAEAPGTDGTFLDVPWVTTNDSGDLVFLATVKTSAGPRSAIYHTIGGAPEPVAIEGQPIEELGDGVVIQILGDVKATSDRVAFQVYLAGPGIDLTNQNAVMEWSIANKDLAVILRASTPIGVEGLGNVGLCRGFSVDADGVYSFDIQSDEQGGFQPKRALMIGAPGGVGDERGEDLDLCVVAHHGTEVSPGGEACTLDDVRTSDATNHSISAFEPEILPSGGTGQAGYRAPLHQSGVVFWSSCTRIPLAPIDGIFLSRRETPRGDPLRLSVRSNLMDVPIEVAPPDPAAPGETPFVREYDRSAMVRVTAPAAAEGEDGVPRRFLRWEVDGEQLPHGELTATVTMDDDHVLEAVYQIPVTDPDILICCLVEIIENCFADCPPPRMKETILRDGELVEIERTIGPGGWEVGQALKAIKWRGGLRFSSAPPYSWAFIGRGNRVAGSAIYLADGNYNRTLNFRELFVMDKCSAVFTNALAFAYHNASGVLYRSVHGDEWSELLSMEMGLGMHTTAIKFRRRLMAMVGKIRANRTAGVPDTDGVDPCFNTFTDCTDRQLDKIQGSARIHIEAYHAFYGKFTADNLGVTPLYEAADAGGAGGGASREVGLAEQLYGVSFPLAQREEGPLFIAADLRRSVLEQADFDTDPARESTLETGIQTALDLVLLQDATGADVLLVLGTTHGYLTGDRDSGVIKSYRDTDADGFFDQGSERVLVMGDASLQSASSFTRDPQSGRSYVYDAILRTLRRFEDTDGDDIPDALAGGSIIPDDPELLVEIGVVWFSDRGLEAHQRLGDVVVGADMVLFRDENGDGTYETGERGPPARFERAPGAFTLPFFGNTNMQLYGVPGHGLRLDEVTEGGVFLQTWATGSVPADGSEVTVAFEVSLPAGIFLRITDIVNDVASPIFATLPPEPTVYVSDVVQGPPEGGTRVTYQGEHLPAVERLTYDGVPATIVSQSAREVVAETPPHDRGVVRVEFHLEGGAVVLGPPFNYRTPLPAAPVADPGEEQTVVLAGDGVEVVLDGSASSAAEPARPITESVWTGRFEGGIALGASPTVTFTSAGDHRVVLVVSDGTRVSEPVATTIHVVRDNEATSCGDANGDGNVDVADASALLRWLFLGGDDPIAPDRLVDFNGDGQIDVSDAVGIVRFLFVGGVEALCPM